MPQFAPNFSVSRRTALGGAAVLPVLLLGDRTLARPALDFEYDAARKSAHSAATAILRLRDRGLSRWRRVHGKPAIPASLHFRSADRFTPSGDMDPIEGGWWMIDEPVLKSVHAGARAGLDHDSSLPIQDTLAAAEALGRPVDDSTNTYRIDRQVVLPPRTTWLNARLQAGKPGMTMVLISSGSRLMGFDLKGTGTISRSNSGPSQLNERAIYPSEDGLTGAIVHGRISHITVGVHLQPVTGSGPPPRACEITVELWDIVGRDGVSEGYGVLLSPADDCIVRATASQVQRHAVYLSAGSSRNTVNATVDGCLQDAVTIYSTESQPTCEDNVLTVRAKGVRMPAGKAAAPYSSCFSIYGKANGNRAHVIAHGGQSHQEGPYAAALITGLAGARGPFPEKNVLTVEASGAFSGPYVIKCTDTVDTIIEGGRISGSGTVGVIGFDDTRSNDRSFRRAGTVGNISIDRIDADKAGIVVATERSDVVVRANNRLTLKEAIRDYTGKLRKE